MTSRMYDEIHEAPAVVDRLLRQGRREVTEAGRAIRAARPRFVVVVARGTSDHAGVYARYLIEATLGLPCALAAASITTVYRATVSWRDVLLLALSQSGAGPDVAEVTAAARAGGAITVAITNDPSSPLARSAAHVVDCRAGRELSVAATKTYVAELAAIALLVTQLAEQNPLADALDALPGYLEEALTEGTGWLRGGEAPIETLAASDRALVVSRGYNLATALEIALKLKETSRIFADGYSSADLLHGPIVLADPGVPILAFRPDGPMGAAVDDGIRAAGRSGAPLWVIGGREVAGRPRSLVLAPDLPEPLTPLVYAIPGQLLAEAVARARGLDPDRPPGLQKVTRTR